MYVQHANFEGVEDFSPWPYVEKKNLNSIQTVHMLQTAHVF